MGKKRGKMVLAERVVESDLAEVLEHDSVHAALGVPLATVSKKCHRCVGVGEELGVELPSLPDERMVIRSFQFTSQIGDPNPIVLPVGVSMDDVVSVKRTSPEGVEVFAWVMEAVPRG